MNMFAGDSTTLRKITNDDSCLEVRNIKEECMNGVESGR